MKDISSLRVQLAVFSLLFAAGMWMSKVAQPLYFDGHGAMIAFGAGYAVMAVIGGLSFAWGYLADRMGGLNAVRLGGVVYAIGISGRVFTDLVPAIIFSAVAGAGASLALVGVRPWVRSRATDEEIPKIVASRSLGNQSGVFVGTLGAALIFAIAGQAEDGQRSALLVAPVLVLAGIVWITFAGRSSKYAVAPRNTNEGQASPDTRGLSVKLAVLGCLSGFYVSLVAPYAPVILSDAGLTDAGAAVAISVMSLAQIGSTAVLTKVGTSPRPFRLFIFSETATALLTLLAAGLLQLPGLVVAAIFVARSAFLALAATAEETIQYAVIPAAAVGFVFGIAQTAFLVGDAAGGALGAVLWHSTGPWGLLITAGAVTLANAILFPVLLGGKKPIPA
ncbi:MFS transporter [Microbacterium lacticum]|uniref:MFS transporter n=1 Tax=Microbacterium lacticum TaxID=33885 RepID=UPI0018B0209E|nr:MFS transporter [Microbacterium lacticum]MBF9336829.1 MFS transporter [Microbacterium lacticum]